MDRDSQVAIIGMACRFPGGCRTPADYWRLLKNGIDATREVPSDRWSLERFFDPNPEVAGKVYVRRGGFLDGRIDQFDVRLFGLSPREAIPLDPQQRLLLELTWEALEDAGIVPGDVRGSHTGVYVGGFTMDNQIHLLNVLNRETITTHTAISSTGVMLSNRLSYAFDFRGPSLTVDTACSSSLVALHLACTGLMLGECELAVTGGVNVMLRPEYTIAMCKGGFLSPDGRCKTFDAQADGYARGEGAGIIILKRLEAALRDGDQIHAVVAGTGVNQDGRSEGITAPNVTSQIALIREVHARANLAPDQIQYVEAHGTGTRAGDMAETAALGEALALRQTDGHSLWIGSAKTNIGHTEAAAGIAGVIKTTLALKHKMIPPSLHFKQPNPDIPFDSLRLRVPVRLEAWPEHTGPAGAAINSFGYGGTNAHAILVEAPAREPVRSLSASRPVIVPISAASRASLITRIQELADWLDARLYLGVTDVGYNLARRRTHHTHRLALVASSAQELCRQLYPFMQNASEHPNTSVGPRQAVSGAKLAFVFTGMGPQFWGMGAELFQQHAGARRIAEVCDTIWLSLAGWSIADLFVQQTVEPMTEPQYAQPANFVLQLMLIEIASSYGVTPDGIIGHSVGEIAASYVSGSLSLDDALTLVYHRSRLQQRAAGHGKMLAIGLSIEEVQPFLKPLNGRVSIAAINSQNSVTASGEPDAIHALSESLAAADHFNRVLKVDVAYHSHHMDPFASEFKDSLQALRAKTPTVPLYSSVTGAQVDGLEQDPDYWWRNARQTVNFASALTAMIDDGYNTFVEIGPHPVLAASINDSLLLAGAQGEIFAALNRTQPDLAHFLATLASLYARGVNMDWGAQYPSGNLISLPPYPWDRETLWHETEASKIDRLGVKGHPLLTVKPDEPQAVWEGELAGHIQRYLPDHRIQGESIFPAAGFVEMGLVAKGLHTESIAVEALAFHQTLATDETPMVRLCLDTDGSGFTIYSRSRKSGSRWGMNACGTLIDVAAPAISGPLDRDAVLSRCETRLDVDDFYTMCSDLGLEYGASFRCVRQAQLGDREILAYLEVSANHADEIADYYVHPTLLDAAFQSFLAIHFEEAKTAKKIFIPVHIDQVRFHRKPTAAAWCHATVTKQGRDHVTGNVTIHDDSGAACIEILGLCARSQTVRSLGQPAERNLLYHLAWEPQSTLAGEVIRRQSWLIFADDGGIGAQIIRDASDHRIACIQVRHGAGFKRLSDNTFEVARESRQDMCELFQAVDANALDALIYLWALDIPDVETADDGRIATGTVDTIDLTHIIQGLEKRSVQEELTLGLAVIRAQRVTDSDRCYGPGSHALVGFGRVLAIEHPQYRVKIVDLNSRQQLRASADLIAEILSSSNETEVAFRSGVRYVNRLVRRNAVQAENSIAEAGMSYALNNIDPQRLEALTFTEVARVAPGQDELEIEVRVCALDANELTNLDESLPAGEQMATWQPHCAGVIVAVGDGVTRFQVGQKAVILTAQQSCRTHVTVPSRLVVPKPTFLSFLDAVTLPDWIAAHYALFEAGKLDSDDSILIHEAANDSGLAAVRLAQWRGATIYATAWSEEKRAYLRSLGIKHVADSHALGFADDIVKWTNGKGVDVCLCSFTGDLLRKSLGLMADGGRFVYLGRTPATRSAVLPISAFERGLEFTTVDLERLSRERPAAIRGVLQELLSLFETGAVAALPNQLFSATRLEYALRTVSDGQYIGKLAVDMHNQPVTIGQRLPVPIKSDASYLVVGGFGGLGLKSVQWLAKSGARQIAVLSRRGPADEAGREAIHKLESTGICILVVQADVADRTSLAAGLQQIRANLPPLRGVIHSAGVVDDAVIGALQAKQIDRVMGPKAIGAWNLHRELSEEDLDFFVCYSSVTGMLGNFGQANYAAANAFLDGLAFYRKSHGSAGLSINWGVIGDVGMVSHDQRLRDHLKQLGLSGISSEQALDLLQDALTEKWQQIGIFDVDWQQWRESTGGNGTGRLAHVISAPEASDNLASQFRSRILMAQPGERLQLICATVIEAVSDVLRIHSSRIDRTDTLVNLGIDSLMAVELAMVIHERTGARFRTLFIVRGPTILEISESILKEVMSGNPISPIAVR